LSSRFRTPGDDEPTDRRRRPGNFARRWPTFLAVTDLIGLELARQPHPGRSVRTINRLVRRLPQIDYTSGRLHERIFTPQLRALLERFSAASNRLALIAPEPMLEIIDELAGLMAQDEQVPAGWNERWNTARGRLVAATRDVLD
jgi:hypothetical protein